MKNKKRSEWYKFYQDRMNPIYTKHIETRYADFIATIMNNLPELKKGQPFHLHEAGCGAANISKVLHKKLKQNGHNFHISLSDKCSDMLELAHENLPEGYKALIDMTCDPLPKADVIFSHGVLEHFNNETILDIVANQLKATSKVIHYVPSSKYKKPSFGDERLMTAWEWQQICNPTSIIEFNDGYDLILIWDTDKIKYPDYIMCTGDGTSKMIPKKFITHSHCTFEGGMSIPLTAKFFLNKEQTFSYPSGQYAWAKHYRHLTANEELLYGRNT